MRLPPWFETWPVSSTAETLTDSSCCRNGISKCLPVDTFLIAHNIYFTLVCYISSICLNWKTFSTCSHSQFPMVWSSNLIDWSIWSHWPLLFTCHLKDSLRGALQVHSECHAIPPSHHPCAQEPHNYIRVDSSTTRTFLVLVFEPLLAFPPLNTASFCLLEHTTKAGGTAVVSWKLGPYMVGICSAPGPPKLPNRESL